MDIVDTAYIEEGEENPTLPEFQLFSKWGKEASIDEKEKFEVKLSFFNSSHSNDRPKILDKFTIEIPRDTYGATVIHDLKGIEVVNPGWCFLEVSFRKSVNKGKWMLACKIPFMVKKRKKNE